MPSWSTRRCQGPERHAEEACNKGILVISVDQALDCRACTTWASTRKNGRRRRRKWLAEKLGGKGEIVQIEGFPGHPANVARMDGVAEVLEELSGHQGAGDGDRQVG